MKKYQFLAVVIVFLLVPVACAFPSPVATSVPTTEPVNTAAPVATEAPATEPTKPAADKPTTAPSTSGEYSQVIYSDDFSNDTSGWEIGDYEGGSIGYGNGYYFVRASEDSSVMWGVAGQNFDGDVIIDVDATQMQAPSNDNNAYGIYCRYFGTTDSTNGYMAMISGDGYYAIVKDTAGDYNEMIDWTSSSAINQGNATNHLTLSCVGNEIALYVNGEFVDSVTDSDFTSGDISLAAITFETDTVTEIHFTNLTVSVP